MCGPKLVGCRTELVRLYPRIFETVKLLRPSQTSCQLQTSQQRNLKSVLVSRNTLLALDGFLYGLNFGILS